MFDRNADASANTFKQYVAHSPNLLDAILWEGTEYEAVEGDTLEIYKSPLVEEIGKLYWPINEFLSETCFLDGGTAETVEDESMAFGSAESRFVLVFRACPGGVYSHSCRADRVG